MFNIDYFSFPIRVEPIKFASSSSFDPSTATAFGSSTATYFLLVAGLTVLMP